MTVDLAGALWFKSSRSSTGGECVEVAHLSSGRVGVRDSKNPTGPALVFAPAEWDAFAAEVKDGEFDRPA
ncbi:DUF397 domain-containing protein [Nocardia terpenica]|uniref:DUF397 domain-containing protein n=1 Tax=Nocardia terpenica TaxID=455432 RepID=UPI0002DB3CE8|nr:DUF397 domain-containing protein [Nocardia terpenica]MBF6059833.1 DUF397 domain-containing protein [Nocardia terpenica]MBF6102626.1 DUF397 domain-containing protein [Nocardia terpenica]MBF6111183.1 DUF397 domain-containing protein [Nocardia terpenica]MBF6117314.1 DUF397 domain-containing protein [Nocardia terpenica]MBF6150845.1 DUF397 domain-containing protein [Nocardia terpenica]